MDRRVAQLQKFEAIGRLVGGISHDFNNMIGAILGWAEMGREETSPLTVRIHDLTRYVNRRYALESSRHSSWLLRVARS